MDSRLRELERRARAGDDVDAQARALLERVRLGDLARDRLDLAVYCGDPIARVAVGDHETYWIAVRATDMGDVVSDGEWNDGRPCRGYVPDLRIWVRGFSVWARREATVPVRALLVAAERRLDSWLVEIHEGGKRCRMIGDREGCSAVRHALHMARAWVEDPGPKTGDAWSRSFHPHLPLWVPVSTMALDGGGSAVARAMVAVAEKVPEYVLRDLIREALVSWALGGSP